MEQRTLGRTGIRVSTVALGTVSLGVDYGIPAPGEFGRPGGREAIALIERAVDVGVSLLDTAPGYGEAERLIGAAIGPTSPCLVATKVAVPRRANGTLETGEALERAVGASIEHSLVALRRDAINVLQIHNATSEVLQRGELTAALLRERERGRVRFLGASVYGEEAALDVIESGAFDTLQVAYSVLDQRMGRAVFPAAARARVAVLVRSVYLKGALTAKARWLPEALAPLRAAAERAKDVLAGSWDALPAAALRFCLSSPDVSSLLIGARTWAELSLAIEAAARGALPAETMAMAPTLRVDDERLVDPSRWPAG